MRFAGRVFDPRRFELVTLTSGDTVAPIATIALRWNARSAADVEYLSGL
jgi:hypothetical protein